MFLGLFTAIWLPLALLPDEPPAPAPGLAAPPPHPDFLVREIRYDGALTETQARFVVDIDAEMTGKSESSVVLFEGDVALLPARLPAGVRVVRDGNQYRLVASRSGRYRLRFEVVARITRAEPWNQVSFAGPQAGISMVAAAAESESVEVQLLSGTPLESSDQSPGRVRGVLASDRTVALRWQSRTAEAARRAVVTCETAATVRVTPTVVKFSTEVRYDIVQGNLARLAVIMPASHALTRVEGAQVRDWQTVLEGNHQVLTVELIKPVEKTYTLTIQSEQPVESVPFQLPVHIPKPRDVDRESGTLSIIAEDTVVEMLTAAGLRQVNAVNGAFATYRFHGRPLELSLKLNRVEPFIDVATRVTSRVEESRLLVAQALSLNVEKAGVYGLEISPVGNHVVTDVVGEGIEDWKVREGVLQISFSSRLLGRRTIEVRTEQTHQAFPDQVTVLPLRVRNASRQSTQIGVAPAAGIRVKTLELAGLREIPAAGLTNRTDELLGFVADQADWSLKLSTEKLAPRIIADVFNLVTIGDGLLGGSASIRYVIVNQGVQEFRIQVPASWRNVEFTGANIRRKDQQGDEWTIALQEKVWGGYTLVVTYDEQFDPGQATLSLGGLHALGVERETGSVAITSAAGLQLRESRAGAPLRRVDESELADTDRALITRSVLLAYRYDSSEAFQLAIDVSRFPQMPVLEAVADRTQLTTALTESGEMLTQALFMVKNNDKQFQRFTLPQGAKFWSAFVNGQPARAESDGADLLVPLPRGANRDQSFAVEIVYAENVGALKSLWPRNIALSAPVTDVQTTFAEWEVFVPAAYGLGRFGGNMSVARGTTYGWNDAWSEWVEAYRSFWLNTRVLLLGLGAIGVMFVLVTASIRRGWNGAVGVLTVVTVLAVLAGMLLPSLAKSKAKAQRISAVNSLKQIGLAARLYAGDHGGRLPASFAEMRDELGTDKVTIDPQTGQPFVYLGEKLSEVDADSVLAYAPVQQGARAVLFADGSVQQLDDKRFKEALQKSAANGADTPLLGAIPAGGVAGTPNPTSPAKAAAMVQGVRPIRIDVPRAGQRFVFTKVLNVGRTPLAFQASAITTSTLHLARSLIQVTAFLVGLLILWRQLRRATPRSLPVTLGAALVITSVVCLLVVSRWLGLALIVLVPLTAFALLVLLARRYFRRPGADESMASGVASPQPPPLGGAPGVGPAVAGLMFLLFAGMTQAAEQSVSATPPDAPPAIEAATLESATYSGTVRDRVAVIDAVLVLTAARPGAVIPLFGKDVAIEEFSAGSRDTKLIRKGDALFVQLARKGSATVNVRFWVKLEGDVTGRRLAFAIPSALSSKLTLSLNEPEAAVEFPSAISVHRVSSAQETRIEAVVGAASRIDLSWTPRVKRAAEIAATVFSRNASLVTFTGGSMHVQSTIDYQISQGELREIRVGIPKGHRLLRVEGEFIRTWQVTEDGGRQVVAVELLKGMTPDYRLRVETETAIDGLPAALAVETPHALEVKRETGLVALMGGEDLGLLVDNVAGLQKVDVAEFLKVAGSTPAPVAAFEYLKPEFALGVRVETLKPLIEATVRNHLQVGNAQLLLTAQVDYTIRRAGVFTLPLAVPADFRIEAVTGSDLMQWIERTNDGRRTIEVALKQRTMGHCTLQLQLARPLPELPKSIEVTGVHPLETAKLGGFVIVGSEAGVQVRTVSFEGLTEVPVTSVPGGASGLAYKFVSSETASAVASWRLVVATEAIGSWVRAEVANWLTLDDSLVTGRAIVRFDVQNAPVKEFRLRIPAAFRNIEIIGADIRRRDQAGEDWHIELQNRVSGSYLLTVTWDQPWSIPAQAGENDFLAAGIGVSGVERETGFLAFTAKSRLQLSPKQAGGDLIRLDTQDLPAWAGAAPEGTILAYRYLRTGYQLSLTARRFTPAEVLQAIVDDARLTTVVADDGQMMTELTLLIRNNGRQFLEVALPAGAQVWSAFVAGQAVKPGRRGDRLLLPLEQGADSVIPVELVYVGAEPFPRISGPVSLASPSLDVPVKNARWELYLPPDYGYGRFGGTMTRELEAAPVYASYTLSEYSRAEDRTKKARELEASSSVNEVREKLSRGRLDEANKAYNLARRYRLEGEQEEIVKLEKDLRKAQSSNLLNAQQAVFANNAGFLRQSPDLPALQVEAKFDAGAAGEQWVRLQQAQEVSTSTVRPLRVNLPARGVRHSFSLALQTEVGKPMRVSFTASNAATPNWTMRIALGVLGFTGLWLLIHRLIGRRNAVAVSAATA